MSAVTGTSGGNVSEKAKRHRSSPDTVMPSYVLDPMFPNKELQIELIVEVKNLVQLKESAIKGDIQACFINPEYILDPFQILIAANKALHSEDIGKLKTRSLYTELLYNLSPTTKINASLQTFGIDEKSANILVAVLGTKCDADAVMDRIEGKHVPLKLLSQMADEDKIKKAYKVDGNQERDLLGSVLTAMAIKDVK